MLAMIVKIRIDKEKLKKSSMNLFKRTVCLKKSSMDKLKPVTQIGDGNQLMRCKIQLATSQLCLMARLSQQVLQTVICINIVIYNLE